MGLGSKPLSVHRFRLTTFNFASYPFLLVPSTELFGLAAMGLLVSVEIWGISSFRIHRAPKSIRFFYRACPSGHPPCDGPSAPRRGDFPQCRTLSVVLLIPDTEERGSFFNLMESQCNPVSTFIIVSTPLLGLFIPFELFWCHSRLIKRGLAIP